MSKQHWIVKQEPETYSWTTFAMEKRAAWTGVRNFQARNNLRAMKKGDFVFYYHSGEEKQIVGIARVATEPYPDPTAEEGDWVCVDLEAVKPLREPVALATMKTDAAFANMLLVQNSRLSVSPMTPEQFQRVLELGKTKV